MQDSLLEQQVRAAFKKSFSNEKEFSAWHFLAFKSCGSSMDEARKLLESRSELTRALVITQNQESGRGRQGRVWLGAKEALLATYLFSLPLPVEQIQCAPLLVGLTLSELCDELGVETYLKWPNDLLSKDGKKLAGILIELIQSAGRNYLSIGIGLNIFGEPLSEAASFQSLGVSNIPPLSELSAKLAKRLEDAFSLLEREGFKKTKERWLNKALGLRTLINTKQAESIVSGTFEGISEQGYLLLRDLATGELRQISSGDIEIICASR